MRFHVLVAIGAVALASCANQAGFQSGDSSLRLADAAMQGDAPGMALKVADAVLDRDSSNVPALLRQGAALAALGRTGEAALSYRRAMALRPRSREARIGLARLELEKDPAEADTLLEAVLRERPHDVTALVDRGVALDLEGRHTAAEASYRRALARQPDATAAEVDLALSLALVGEPRRAVGMLRPLASGPGSTPRVRDDLAVALAMSGDADGALQILAASLSRSQAAAAISAYRQLAVPRHP